MDDQKAYIIGRNLLPKIDVRLIQETNKQTGLNIREQEESDPDIKQWVKNNFQQICIRIGKLKNHTMKTQFSKDFMPIQQKGDDVFRYTYRKELKENSTS